MNKEELIKRIKNLPLKEGPIADTVTVNREWLLNSIEKLDELKEVEIPQFIADWYENSRDDFDYRLWDLIHSSAKGHNSDITYWIENTEDALITLVKMHLFGYTIKEDKKYLVRMIGIISGDNYLNYDSKTKRWYFDNSIDSKDIRTYHTNKDLNESGFGDVFSSTLFEVTEVKE